MPGVALILRRIYLITYNCAGWFQVLYVALKTLIESGHMHVYGAIEYPLLLAQSAAFFEIIQYSFFGMKEIQFCTLLAIIAKVCTFLILYPLGIGRPPTFVWLYA